jgi:hypothetical protein
VQFLRYSFHPEYAKPDTNIQVNTSVGVVVDEATRQRLIEFRARLLKDSGNGTVQVLPANQDQQET